MFSIIVPVYNSEEYLDKCIQSILKQTYSTFEVILVDDGSKDKSLQICKEYANTDNRVKVLSFDNAGVSAARNRGIEEARGQYIVFIDSDDIVDKRLLEKLADSKADLVSIGFDDYDYSSCPIEKFCFEDEFEIKSDSDILSFINRTGSTFVWAKRYKKSIIDLYNIRFEESLPFSEDIVFNNEYILHTNSLQYISYVGYHHCHYQKETLSNITAKYPLIERIRWREITRDLFVDHRLIQIEYAKNFLYLSECEIKGIASEESSYYSKIKKIYKLIGNHFFKVCLSDVPDYFNKPSKIIFEMRLIPLIIKKYM